MVLFMDLDIEVGLSRTFDADGDKWEKKNADFFRTIERGYREASKHPQVAPLRENIDASGTQDEVRQKLLNALT
ncbi:MAG: hypothetical protein H6766_05865 [Candidatus Peribacteria bacterium]|nr:MAG: hypothetical protein H6766_05865 [Candidatus Peribacteria bacterium]